jgi:hypothetical protein
MVCKCTVHCFRRMFSGFAVNNSAYTVKSGKIFRCETTLMISVTENADKLKPITRFYC